MKAVERLKRDHGILRSKLDVLESALRMGPDTWFVLREMCFTLAHQLRDHMRREELLILTCRQAMNPAILAEIAVEHKDEPAHLRTINRLFVQDTGHTLERIRPALTEVIQGLRRHMLEEERELFPILEQILTRDMPDAATSQSPSRLEETMTVNRVIQQFPKTRRILEQLFINIPIEGCTCLDEVAWRHGMESPELLTRLEDAIRGTTPPLQPSTAEATDWPETTDSLTYSQQASR